MSFLKSPVLRPSRTFLSQPFTTITGAHQKFDNKRSKLRLPCLVIIYLYFALFSNSRRYPKNRNCNR